MAGGDEPFPLDAETREVIRLLKAAAARCKKIMLNPPGGKESARSFHASRAAQQLQAINRELDAVKVKLASVGAKKVGAAYRDGLAYAEKLARDQGVRVDDSKDPRSAFDGSFNVVDRRRAQVLAQQTVGDLAKAVDSIKTTTGKVVRQTQALNLDSQKVNTLLAGGTIEGAPKAALRELKKVMQAAAIDGKIVTVNTQTGEARNFKPDDYAELVFQTKLAETTNVATIQRLQARKIFYVKIIGSSSRNFCTAFVGRVFYIGEGTDPLGLFPHVRELPRGGPPFHPRCTKRYTAFVPKLATPEQINEAKLAPHERELLNKTPSEAQRAYGAPPASPDPAPVSGSLNSTAGNPPGPPAGPSPSIPQPPAPPPVEVGTRFILPKSGRITVAAADAVRTIELLHKLPAGARPMPVRVVPNGRFEGQIKIGPAWQLQINASARWPESTMAHEMGHYFELEAVGGIRAAMTHPAFADWRSAVQQTRTFQQLMLQAMRTRSRLHTYFVRPEEVFARSYAQWVAESGNLRMMQQMQAIRALHAVPTQWDSLEFAPIAQAFDKAIVLLGLQS